MLALHIQHKDEWKAAAQRYAKAANTATLLTYFKNPRRLTSLPEHYTLFLEEVLQ